MRTILPIIILLLLSVPANAMYSHEMVKTHHSHSTISTTYNHHNKKNKKSPSHHTNKRKHIQSTHHTKLISPVWGILMMICFILGLGLLICSLVLLLVAPEFGILTTLSIIAGALILAGIIMLAIALRKKKSDN